MVFILINSHQVQCFLVLAETLSFTKAAQQLYMSQPVLSRKIAALEEELGIVLINRHPVSLTKEGAELREFFKKYTDEFNELMSQLVNQKDEGGKIHIGVFEGCDLSDFLHTIIYDFHVHYDHIQITFDSGSATDLYNGLNNGEFDLLIMLEVGARALFKNNEKIIPLFPVSKCLVYGDSNEVCKNEDITIESFKNQPQLCLDHSPIPYDVITNRELFDNLGYQSEVIMFKTLDSLSLTLLSGKGYAIVDDSTRLVHYQGVHSKPLGDAHNITLVYKDHVNNIVEILVDYLLERYA